MSNVSAQNCDVVFVTAGEYPSVDRLQGSQVLEPAAALASRGYRVAWISVMPFLAWLRDLTRSEPRLRAVRERCRRDNIDFHAFVAPLSIGGLLTFLFRRPITQLAARRVARVVSNLSWPKTVLHARSYYAAEVACSVKELLPRIPMRVSFDMRSTFAEELPLILGLPGRLLYGFAKQWELDLLLRSDLRFLPVHHSRQRIATQSGIAVQFSPISGFDREPGWTPDLDRRWEQRRIGFAGAFGDWHDPALLKRIFDAVRGSVPLLAASDNPQLAGLDFRTFKYSGMAGYYDGLFALVIPGRQNVSDFFIAFQMRCNLFSTKASEALTRGVPLVVCKDLSELAAFVIENDCGAVFDPLLGRFSYPSPDWFLQREEWERISRNAFAVGATFTKSAVLSNYVNHWNGLFVLD